MLNQSFEDDRGAKFVRRGLLDQAVLKSEADLAIERFDIRTQGSKSLAGKLSGGNQQKVSVSKWLAAETKILVIDEPTVGVDVRTKASFHELITQLADEGLSIILISSDLAEMVAVADRILVMRRYELVGDLDNSKDYQSMSRSIMNSIQTS
mgnify:CR=1 FL=1